ncbi:putative otopetrin [Operophtera brumata]|uniref:Putative otopetrin n=1 Tax=Operophtera brumata TaxID=104452 RepID=A0A0L7KTX5_OPEBR|nr:putative otopetrin [Operophtera brumata]
MSPTVRPLCEASDARPAVTVTDMDTVHEENDNDSDESSYSDVGRLRERTRAMLGTPVEPLMHAHSQPNSRRIRPSAIIAAFRRPSQALALCAATQRRFLSELSPHSRASMASTAHDTPPSAAEIMGHEALSKALSALYAKLLVVLGLAFPVTEVIANGVPDAYYQGFYLYLIICDISIREHNEAKGQDSEKDEKEKDKNGKTTPAEKLKQKESISRYGSFYLRLGAIAFGIGSMVYSGLEFGEYFEMTDRCRSVLSVITPGLRMTLTLAQMQFIFLTNKDIESGSYKMIQRFGFMHMVATNLCEWLYVLVEETKHEIHHLEHSILSSANGTHNETEALPCRRANIMGALLQNASPFLFPCTIEYSLICAVILYEMWKEALHHFSVDCSHAHRGLFAGILVIVLTIISLIMFFVLANNPDTVIDAIFEVNICELVLYSLTLVACTAAIKQMRALPYKRSRSWPGHSGMFVYCMFSLIGCHHTMTSIQGSGLTGFFSEFLSLNQRHVRTAKGEAWTAAGHFPAGRQHGYVGHQHTREDAWWRRSATSEQRREKPGRQLVTFLLVANMAMWAINTLEKTRGGVVAPRQNSEGRSLDGSWSLSCWSPTWLYAWWRRSATSEQRREKPGRQLVTFLLVANMAMWAINTLEKTRGGVVAPRQNSEGRSLDGSWSLSCWSPTWLYAWWRRSATSEQRRENPGRPLVTFLLVANMAMWAINTLEKTRGGVVAPRQNSEGRSLDGSWSLSCWSPTWLYAWWRRSATSEQRREKPGRQLVTFLLVANMAMWAINTLEKTRGGVVAPRQNSEGRSLDGSWSLSCWSPTWLYAWWRRSATSEQRREKPGRQLVTFLLVANMAMWAINTLEKTRGGVVAPRQNSEGRSLDGSWSLSCWSPTWLYAWWRRSATSEQRREKPGRQLVTFLLVANMAMWAINTLEKTRGGVVAPRQNSEGRSLDGSWSLSCWSPTWLYAWWRRSATSEQRREKPGRQLVTFLLVANMAMWAINTLEKTRGGVVAPRQNSEGRSLDGSWSLSCWSPTWLYAWWRRSATSEQRREKPGRQLVTFLLVANMAMWAINTLEKNRAEFRPAHLAFYGPWAWTIITHVSMPLAIFYRFHSTICLFEIWKNCFKNKPIYLNV